MTGFAFRTPRFMVASIRSRFALSLILAGFAQLPVAHAADKAPPARAAASAPAPAAKSPILTPAQLQQCVNQRERLHAQTDDALKDKAAIAEVLA